MKRLPIHRLWFQFSLAFSGVVILASLGLAFLGYLLRPAPAVPPPPPDTEQAQARRALFLHYRNRGLLITIAVGSTLGIAAGVWMSRRLTAPLEELAEGTQAISAGRFSYRVAERGSQELRTLAQSFNAMAAALESAERQRQNLLADVAHELRTPLTVLQSNLRAILDDVYTLDKSEVARLYDQTRHLSRLVNDLHELAQAEARQLPLDRRPVDLNEVVQAAVELLEPVAELEGIHLDTRLPGHPVMVNGDGARLMQICQNLLSNALRHTPAGGTITVTVEATGDEASLTVADTGDGIEPGHLPHVFDRFYRTSQARDRDSGGTGLGLAIVRALVEAHGGRVSAHSPGQGQGSTFRAIFPRSSSRPSESWSSLA